MEDIVDASQSGQSQSGQGRQGSAPYRAELKATGKLAIWCIAWVATLALARFGPGVWGESQHAITWVAVGLNLIAGIGWIVAFAYFLRTIDELQRKILQDALIAALGAGFVLGFGFVVAEAGGLIPIQVDFAMLPVAMAVVYMIAFVAGKIRYR
jgi:hypothetical protein